jgi:hypothetical protein
MVSMFVKEHKYVISGGGSIGGYHYDDEDERVRVLHRNQPWAPTTPPEGAQD